MHHLSVTAAFLCSLQTSNSRVGYPSERRARVTPATRAQRGRRGGKGGRTERSEGEKRLLVIGAKSSFAPKVHLSECLNDRALRKNQKKNKKTQNKTNTAVKEF